MLSASWSDAIASIILKMERVKGIEPSYPAWKAGVLANVLYPRIRGIRGMDTPEKIGTLKKGEKIFFFISCNYIIQKIFRKINFIFLETNDNILDMPHLG